MFKGLLKLADKQISTSIDCNFQITLSSLSLHHQNPIRMLSLSFFYACLQLLFLSSQSQLWMLTFVMMPLQTLLWVDKLLCDGPLQLLHSDEIWPTVCLLVSYQ